MRNINNTQHICIYLAYQLPIMFSSCCHYLLSMYQHLPVLSNTPILFVFINAILAAIAISGHISCKKNQASLPYIDYISEYIIKPAFNIKANNKLASKYTDTISYAFSILVTVIYFFTSHSPVWLANLSAIWFLFCLANIFDNFKNTGKHSQPESINVPVAEMTPVDATTLPSAPAARINLQSTQPSPAESELHNKDSNVSHV